MNAGLGNLDIVLEIVNEGLLTEEWHTKSYVFKITNLTIVHKREENLR